MRSGPHKGVDPTRPTGARSAHTRPCGFPFTTTGRPCQNRVPAEMGWCRAGHPCRRPGVADPVQEALEDFAGQAVTPSAVTLPVVGPRPRSRRTPRTRRATELVRQAMASEDVEHLGLRADHVLGDGGAAAALLGSPDASPAARAAVVQRFGRVGALLVIGYEDRWRRARDGGDPDAAGPGDVDEHRRDVEGAARPDGERALEVLVREFERADAARVYELLCEIDRDDRPPGRRDDGADAHRWLDATYAVAARDGSASAHRAYMRALDRVMRLVRILVAS
jgi:hypothetical protein